MPNTPNPQAAKAEALLLHFTAEAHRRKWSYDRGLDDDGVPVKSEAFDALHRLGEEMRTALEELRRTPAVVPSAAETTNRAALLREAADELAALDPAEAALAGQYAFADAAAHLRRRANEAEFAATPCSPMVPCEDGGEPCDVHERLLGHYDDSHELCAPDCGTAGGPSRVAAGEQAAETQARLPLHEWFVETRMLDGRWSKYGASRDTAEDGRELFERDTTGSGKAHAFRLVHASTTYAVEAEHQPDTDPQDAPPVEPHPTEADLRHALAIRAATYGRDTDAPAVAEQPDTQTREADRTVAYVLTARTELHCLRCTPNPAGDIWTPVSAEELDDGGICTACGRDVLIPAEPAP